MTHESFRPNKNAIIDEDAQNLYGEAPTNPIPAQEEPERQWSAPGFDGKDTTVTPIEVHEQHARVDIPVRRGLGHAASIELSADPHERSKQVDDFFANRAKPTEITPAAPLPSFEEANPGMYHAPSQNAVRYPGFKSRLAEMHEQQRSHNK